MIFGAVGLFFCCVLCVFALFSCSCASFFVCLSSGGGGKN